MPQDPRRDYELKITKAIRNILYNDEYFQGIYKNKEVYKLTQKISWKIFERSFVLFTIPAFPALSVHLNEIEFKGLVNIRPKIIIECAWQDADLAVAKAETIKSLKDIRYTLRENMSLMNTVDGEYIQVGFSDFSKIETSFFGEEDGIWTHISEMELTIETA